MRDFYNANLARLPEDVRSRLCREIRADRTLGKHFELVVGRFLQELGAERLEYEVRGSEGRRVDWLAHFPDGSVSVEATAPTANAVVGDTLAESRRAVEAIIAAAPAGWWVMVGQVPRFGFGESLRSFRRELHDVFRDVPPPQPGATWSVERMFANGRLDVGLLPMSDPARPAQWGSGPAVGHGDDTSDVVAPLLCG